MTVAHDFPPELDPTLGATPEPVRRAAPVLAVGLVVIALFNAQGLAKWAEALPEGRLAGPLIAATARWHDATRVLGTAAVFDAVRRAFRAFRGE
jgi:hypothetical protein